MQKGQGAIDAMNIERAFRRRDELAQRLRRTASLDLTTPAYERHPKCPNAVYGQHGTPNWRGRCPYCDHQLSRGPRLTAGSSVPDIDIEDVIDEVTLEPVEPVERSDQLWKQRRRARP